MPPAAFLPHPYGLLNSSYYIVPPNDINNPYSSNEPVEELPMEFSISQGQKGHLTDDIMQCTTYQFKGNPSNLAKRTQV